MTIGNHAQSPTTPNRIVACEPATNKADPKLALEKAAVGQNTRAASTPVSELFRVFLLFRSHSIVGDFVVQSG